MEYVEENRAMQRERERKSLWLNAGWEAVITIWFTNGLSSKGLLIWVLVDAASLPSCDTYACQPSSLRCPYTPIFLFIFIYINIYVWHNQDSGQDNNDTLFPPQSEVSPKAKCKMLPTNYELTSPNIHPIWPQGGFAPSIRIRTDVKLRLEENCVKQGDVTVKLSGPLVQTTNDTGQGMHNNQLLLLDFLGGSEDLLYNIHPQVISTLKCSA